MSQPALHCPAEQPPDRLMLCAIGTSPRLKKGIASFDSTSGRGSCGTGILDGVLLSEEDSSRAQIAAALAEVSVKIICTQSNVLT